ncbi:TPA: LlaJI family restriction endonuclease [Legionella pneumophila]|nr:LlaJI family restriction endonuclease [Legionella pneumophila]
MNYRVNLFNDQVSLENISLRLRDLLISNNIISENDNVVSFCGVVFIQNETYLFFPRNMNINCLDEASIRYQASHLLHAIHMYSNQTKGQLIYDGTREASVLGDSLLGIIFELISDYLINGLYSQKVILTKKNQGKIDWRKTINSSLSFFTENGPIFFDTWGKKTLSQVNSEITKIHAKLIRFILDKFGWLFSVSPNELFKLFEIPEPIVDDSNYISILSLELNLVFADREIWLLNTLIKFLRIENLYSGQPTVIGIKNFHSMWEHMLSNVLEYRVHLNHLMPVPAYNIVNNKKLMPAVKKSLRTDIILKNPCNNIYCIIDAKYYSATTIDSSPGWNDLIKQFFYAKALETIIHQDSEIRNVFVFPGTEQYLLSAHLIDRLTNTNLEDIFPAINCIYLSPSEVIDYYVSGRKLKTISDELISKKL